MDLKLLKYGYYIHYNSGDGSMYDHCTSYTRAPKHNTIFSEDDKYYYDILDANKPYNKNAKYGETLVTIDGELLDILPSCIDATRDYSLGETISLLPRKMLTSLNQKKSNQLKKVL